MDFSGEIGGARHSPRPEINLVPFIDILLALLVIFIVASPALTHAVKLELPRASSRAERREADQARLSILADGRILLEGEPVDPDSLEHRLRARRSGNPATSVRIAADGRASYEAVARTMAAAARAGISRISFASVPEIPR